MGTQFYNLSVHGADLDTVRSACPDYTVRCIAPGWITVTDGSFECGKVQNAAKYLSKKLEYPVLSTEYFDDDYAEFSIFSGGKKICRHVPADYGWQPRSQGRSRVWASILALSEEAEKNLKVAFKERSLSLTAWEAVRQMMTQLTRYTNGMNRLLL